MRQNGGKAKTIVRNSLLMCAVALIMRAVGVAFGVYLSNKVGAVAIGIHSLITSVWGFALTLATSGINLAATRCVAEANDSGAVIRAAVRKCVALACVCGALSATLLFFAAPTIAANWLKTESATLPLRLSALSLPAIAVSSALSGYFSAVRRVWKSAVSQLSEQGIKIFATVALLRPLLPHGEVASVCAVILGAAIAEILSLALSVFLYLRESRPRLGESLTCAQSHALGTKIFGISFPTAVSSYIRSGLTTVEHILIPASLVSFGMSRAAAIASYGVLTGMVFPVITLPYALINSFTALLVPEVAGATNGSSSRRLSYIASRVWHLCLLLGFAAAGVMGVLAREIGQTLYSSTEAGEYVSALAPLLPVMYLDTVTDSMLKGLGDQVYTMNVNVADAALSVLLVRLLLPRAGIYGYIAVLYVSELINFALSAARLIGRTGLRVRVVSWIGAPLACAVGASRISVLLFQLFPLFSLSAKARLAVHVCIVSTTFVIFARLCGALDKETCSWLFDCVFSRKKAKKDSIAAKTAPEQANFRQGGAQNGK